MTDKELIDWIDNASLEDLLRKWRFSTAGRPWFIGAVGQHYTATITRRRTEAGPAAWTAASKAVGWD